MFDTAWSRTDRRAPGLAATIMNSFGAAVRAERRYNQLRGMSDSALSARGLTRDGIPAEVLRCFERELDR